MNDGFAVIAYIDRDADTLAALITRIGTWDDDPGCGFYPLTRYQCATQQAVSFVSDFLTNKEKATGRAVPNEEVADDAIPLIEGYVLAEYRDAALAFLREVPPGTTPMDLMRSDGDPGTVELCAAAAEATWLATSFGVPQTARLHLVRVRDADGLATGDPTAERILDVSEDDALAFLAALRHRIDDILLANGGVRRRSIPPTAGGGGRREAQAAAHEEAAQAVTVALAR